MSGLVDAFDPVKLPNGRRADLRPEPSMDELWDASRIYHRSDRFDAETLRTRRGYAPLIDALDLPDTENPASFEDGGVRGSPVLRRSRIREGGGWMGAMSTRAEQKVAVFGLIRERRRSDPNFLKGIPDDPIAFEQYMLDQEKQRRAAARDTLNRAEGAAGTIATFGGGAFETMLDPINMAMLPIGGGGRTIAQVAVREALINAVIEGFQQPIIAERRATMGEDMTLGEQVANTVMAAIGGGVLGGGIKGAELGGRALYDLAQPLDRRLARALEAADPVDVAAGGRPLFDAMTAQLSDEDLAATTRALIGVDRMTPDERAAANIADRDAEIAATNPYVANMAGAELHAARLSDMMEQMLAIDMPARAPSAPAGISRRAALMSGTAAPAPVSGDARVRFKAMVRSAESSGDDAARNKLSSATGRYQFTSGTWLRYYKTLYPGSGLSDAQILSKRGDGAVQERLMDRLIADNSRALARAGMPETAGNLYLLHFAGEGGGLKILRADPDAPIERVLTPQAISANPFLRGKSAGDVVAWAHGKMREPVLGGEGRARLRGEGFADDEALMMAQRALDQAELDRQRLDMEAERAAGGEDLVRFADDAEGLRAWDEDGGVPAIEARPAAEWGATVERLRAAQGGDAPGALFHAETGPIGVRWGAEDGQGLARILREQPELVEQLPTLIADMAVVKQTLNRVQLESADGSAIARLDWDADGNGWQLAAFEQRSPVDRGAAGDATIAPLRDRVPEDLAAIGEPVLMRGRDGDVIDTGFVSFRDAQGRPFTWSPELGRANGNAPMREGVTAADVRAWAGLPARADRGVPPTLETDVLARFDDPEGAAMAEQADSLLHDLQMRADAEQLTVRLSEDGDEIRLSDALAALDEDAALIERLRACMKPAGGAA